MAFTVSGLLDYTKKANKIFTEGVLLDGKYEKYENIRGIRGTQYMNFSDTDLVYAAIGCGTTASGGTAFTERAITVTGTKIQTPYCWTDLDQKGLPSNNEVAASITEEARGHLAVKLETVLWKGSTTPTITGWYAALRADSDIITVSGTSTPSQSNIIGIISGMTAQLTDRIRYRMDVGGLEIYCSNKVYEFYKKARLAKDHYRDQDADMGKKREMWLFDYFGEIKIIGTSQFPNDTDLLLTTPKNLIIGRDGVINKDYLKWVDNDETDMSILKGAFWIGPSYKYAQEAIVWQYIS